MGVCEAHSGAPGASGATSYMNAGPRGPLWSNSDFGVVIVNATHQHVQSLKKKEAH